MLREAVPSAAVILQMVVLYWALKRSLPDRRIHAPMFLLIGGLSLLLLTQRSALGRPEMFLLIFASAAHIPRSFRGVVAWLAGYLLLVPCYWLGWAYAPFALLLWPHRISLPARVGIAAALGVIHLGFWQWYTGDYLGLMQWLRGTLSVLATENAEMLAGLYRFTDYSAWAFLGTLSFCIALLNRHRMHAALGLGLLLAWLALPNQVRYLPAIAFVALPWCYRQLVLWATARKVTVPSVVVVLWLAAAAILAPPKSASTPSFPLPATARVYSESPYATAFFGQPGISVEPSFAFGATKKPYEKLKDPKRADEHCALLYQGGFTHLVEKSRKQVLACGELIAVDGPWRLWKIK
jgi:hypothetical protein